MATAEVKEAPVHPAQRVLDALLRRHSKDVCVPECKDGPSQMASSHLRMDLWVMPRSWTKPWVTVYEIKTSRRDFMQDEKWPGYLDCCHRFYFACPWGLIEPGEVGPEAGLCWVTRTGSRVITKKKAPTRREVEIPETVWRYILMCRARITREHMMDENLEYWRGWLQEKREKRDMGWRVGREIARQYAEMESRVHLMEKQVTGYELLRKTFEALGFDPEIPYSEWSVSSLKERLGLEVPRALANALSRTRQRIEELEAALAELDGTALDIDPPYGGRVHTDEACPPNGGTDDG